MLNFIKIMLVLASSALFISCGNETLIKAESFSSTDYCSLEAFDSRIYDASDDSEQEISDKALNQLANSLVEQGMGYSELCAYEVEVIATNRGYEIYNIGGCDGAASTKTSIKTNFDGIISSEAIYDVEEDGCLFSYTSQAE